MPCNDNRLNTNLLEYSNALNDITTICNSVDVNYVIVGGDFNTDLKRRSYFTRSLNKYIDNNNLYFCVNDHCNTVQYTYYSKSSDSRSLIDHFAVGNNMSEVIASYD